MELVLASGNAGKLVELRDLLGGSGLTLRAQSEFDVRDTEETGTTFVENALLKARHAARLTGRAALGDDSGLCVDALDGAPGLCSARYAGVHDQKALLNRSSIDIPTVHARAWPGAYRGRRPGTSDRSRLAGDVERVAQLRRSWQARR